MIFYVAAGGMVGAVARYGVMVLMTRLLPGDFPYGTLTANILGSLLMGILTGMAAHHLNLTQEMRAFIAVGILGSFTTFSTFSLDAVALYQRGEMMSMAFYILISVTVSILALVGGMHLVRQLSM